MSIHIQVQRIRAVGLTVADVDRSSNFYTQALGFTTVSDITVTGDGYTNLVGVSETKIRIVTLRLGDELIKLSQYLNTVGKPIPLDSQSNDLWFQHLAIVVSDMDSAYTHLRSFPIEPISTEPQTFPPGDIASAHIRAFKFKDPDHHDLELIWFPPDKGQEKWHQQTGQLFLGIDHSAIAIANTEQSLQFYRDLLGMQVSGKSFNWRETQARLDGLPNATVQVTALRPIQGGLGIELLDYMTPANSLPIPRDWKPFDIAHMQVELVVSDLKQAVDQLQHSTQSSSPSIVQFSNPSFPARKSCLLNDPTGHTVLLITD